MQALNTGAANTITFTALPSRAITTNRPTFGLAASTTSGQPVTFSTADTNLISIAGTNVTLLRAGTAMIIANDPGNINFLPASPVSQQLVINKTPLTVILSNTITTYNGSAQGVHVSAAPVTSSNVSVTYNGFTNLPVNVGSYSVVAMVNNPYYSGIATTNFVISPLPFTFAFQTSNPVVTYNGSNRPVALTNAPGASVITYYISATISLPGGVTAAHISTALANPFNAGSALSSYLPLISTYTNPPSGVGSYYVVAVLTNTNYTPPYFHTNALTIAPISTPAFSFVSTNPVTTTTYNGSNKVVSLTNVGGTPVTVTYNGSTSPPVGAGTYTVVATVTDTNHYTFRSVTNTLVINQASNVISFPLTNRPVYSTNAASIPLQATATSGLPVSYTDQSTNISISSSNQVTILGAGTATIVASQAGDGNYLPAIPVTNALVVAPAVASVSLSNTNTTYNGSAQGVAVTVSPPFLSNKVSITYSNATYGPTSNPPTNAGTYPVVVSVTDPNYAGGVTSSLTIAPIASTFGFSSINPRVAYNGSNQPVVLTNVNGAPVWVYYISSTNSLPGGVTAAQIASAFANPSTALMALSYLPSLGTYTNPPSGVGSYYVLAVNTNTNDYLPPYFHTTSLTIAPISTPAFTFGSTNPVVTYNGSNVTVGLTNNTNGTPVTVTYNGLTSPPVGAGTYTVVATVTDTNNYTFRSVTNTLVIVKAPNVITPTVFAVSPLSYSTSPISVGLVLGASASSGLPVTYSNLSPSLLTLGTTNLILLGAGTATIVASQSGDSNYLAALPVTNPVVITKASNVITFFPLSNWVYNTNGLSNTYGLDAYASSGLQVTFSSTNTNLISISGTNVTLLGVGSGSIVASQNGNSAYAAATPVTNPFTISPKAANYMVTTYAGQTNRGFTNAQGTNAAFMSPGGVALDRSGNLYVADEGNNMIRKIDTNGNVTTLAGNTNSGSQNGQGTNAGFWGPSGVAVDGSGNVYVADQYNNMIRKIDTSGNVITLAGNNAITNAQGWSGGYADGIGTNARFAGPSGVAVDGSGNVYVADQDNNMIRKIDTNGNVTTWAGNNTATNAWGWSGGFIDGIGTNAAFSDPIGVAVDRSGNVYVADHFNSAIRKIDTNDVVTTIIADASIFHGPSGVAVDGSGNLFVSDAEGNAIREISAAGIVTTLAGGSYGWVMQNGLGTNATFNWPTGIAVDAAGHIYVGDIFNNAIRLLTPQ
jgi:streptogramin lyase